MSILSRVLDTASGQKINTERLPTMGVNLNTGGAIQPASQLTQLSAMTSVGWLFAVVNRIAQSIAAQEWKLYRVQGGKKIEIDSHPAIDLWKSANPFITREDFLETSQQHMELVGEMWWVLVRNGVGVPVELQVVRPDRMKPIPHPTEFISGYEYRVGAVAMALEKDDVIYTRNPNPLDQYRGIGVVQSMMVDLGAERLAAEWMQNFFRNSAEPGGIIEFPTNLQDADFERLAERWRFQHQGVANAHRVAILERGTWKDRKITQRDMQFEQLRRFERDQILGAFGMPLPIMGITESVNRANAEAAEVMYARWLVRPRLMRIRSALNEKLLKLYPDGDGLMFDFTDPVPENRVEMINEGSVGYEKKILTLNEARRRFGEDDIEDGDQIQAPAPPPPAPEPPVAEEPIEEEPEEGNPSEEEERGYYPSLEELWKLADNDNYIEEGNIIGSRMERGWKRRLRVELQGLTEYLETIGNEAITYDRTINEHITKITPSDIDAYDWNWFKKYGDEVVDEIAEAYALVLAAEAPNMSIPELQRRASLFAEMESRAILSKDGKRNITNAARQRVGVLVSETIEKGESIGTLTTKLKTDFAFSTEKARTIARTETATALGQGQKEAAKSQGRTEKRWVTSGDALVSEECLSNESDGWISIDEVFSGSGVDTIPEHPNCRCVVQFRNTRATAEEEDKSIRLEVRCSECNRKAGDNIAVGTKMRCRRCKHEWEVK
jgi:HK97 family phage portal protein